MATSSENQLQTHNALLHLTLEMSRFQLDDGVMLEDVSWKTEVHVSLVVVKLALPQFCGVQLWFQLLYNHSALGSNSLIAQQLVAATISCDLKEIKLIRLCRLRLLFSTFPESPVRLVTSESCFQSQEQARELIPACLEHDSLGAHFKRSTVQSALAAETNSLCSEYSTFTGSVNTVKSLSQSWEKSGCFIKLHSIGASFFWCTKTKNVTKQA